ncbi:NDR1/HIN1-like protein [Actinidia chinensis var. chinensis]|uniref:NDR1/HIN1-like protein n=1 Tax=Actinidia chinensis var. chinensis TaxID=1590841 RepID=A0A2R6PHI4_ACTCC|nr:NDR1/HIN1-like protein [Actinidia chinensis var. chinensis]
MKTKYVLPRRRTSPLIWLVAVLCTVIAIAVIIAGIIVFVGYIVIRPKVPFISVIYTHLDVFDFDQAGILTTQVTIQTKWENDNARAHASFYDAGFVLSLHGMEIAKLVADPFDVSKNSSVELGYTVASSSIPLNPELMMLVDMSLKRDLVTFELRGNARTQWRVGILGSVKFWLHLNCQLHFTRSTMNGSSTHCSTKSK